MTETHSAPAAPGVVKSAVRYDVGKSAAGTAAAAAGAGEEYTGTRAV